MRIIKYTRIFLFSLILILSCEGEQFQKKIFVNDFYSHTGIKVFPENIKVLEYSMNYSFGDHVRSIKVKVDSTEFSYILSDLLKCAEIEEISDSLFQIISGSNPAHNTTILIYPESRTIKLTEANL